MYENPINFNQPQKISGQKKSILWFLIIAITITAIVGGFYFWQKEAKPSYIQGYRLVNEKISQSAAIVIHLPKVIEKSIVQQNIQFYPEIEGKWLTSDNEKEIIFKPEEKLKLNRYYSVQLTFTQSEETTIKDDFLVVENPKIIAVFPKEDSEAPETSEITIVFNRPMVPLTTLGYLEEKDIPVTITPATQGRFKWITTRNLQFIPDDRLIRSSHYKVKIKSGLVSMDNLKVKSQESEFITRKLRYLNLTQGKTIYNQPISIYFNQQVDLEKTNREVSLRNNTTGKEISFIAEYAFESNKKLGEKEYDKKKTWTFGNINISNLVATLSNQFAINWSSQEKETEKDINQSVVRVYPKEDRFGREKFWDFENSYSLTIRKAYPSEGDIILDESRNVNISVPSIIRNITAESERTKYAEPNFFDPQGKLWVNFYEEINLDKSKIIVQKLKDIGYGEKCKDEGLKISKDIECEKVPDKERIYISFQNEKIGLGERLEINFERVVNINGLVVNKEPIIRHITSYPELKILKTAPTDNSSGASLTEFVFCSNSPISAPNKEDYKKHFKTNLDYELYSWGNSYKIRRWYSGEKCQVGEFRTNIRYGLMPLADYSLEFKLEDVFGQKLDHSLKFTSGQMPSSHLSF